MVRLTLVLNARDTSINRHSACGLHHPGPIGGLEREFVALPNLLVRRLAAPVVDLAAGRSTPRLSDCERLRALLGSPLIPPHWRRESHAVDACI